MRIAGDRTEHQLIDAVYFDDQPAARLDLAALLADSGMLTVDAAAPPAELDLSRWIQRRPDVFLVDYELAGKQADSEPVNYRGGTLATALREQSRNTPIVLLTRQSIDEWQDDRLMLEALQVFDGIVFKGDLESDPAAAAARIAGIGDAFRELAAANNDFEGLVAVLHARAEEVDHIRAAAPPLVEGGWEVPQLARWIRGVLLAYPGVLVDELHMAALLGLDVGAVHATAIADWLRPCGYSGPLADEAHWWKVRVLDAAASIVVEAGLSGPLFEVFAPAWQRVRGDRLIPARCNFCDEGPAGATCFVLRQPVHHEHSVGYFPDTRPQVMDRARVSFKALRETNAVQDEYVDANAAAIVRDVRRAL